MAKGVTIKSFLKTSHAIYIGTDKGLYIKSYGSISKSSEIIKIGNVGVVSLAITKNGDIYAAENNQTFYEIKYDSSVAWNSWKLEKPIISLLYDNKRFLYNWQ